jgi:hypothetical protein
VKTAFKKLVFGFYLCTAFCAAAASAWAKDAVVAAVATPLSPPNPIIIQNGTQYSQGTYAIGTIQLFYTVQGYQFPAVISVILRSTYQSRAGRLRLQPTIR